MVSSSLLSSSTVIRKEEEEEEEEEEENMQNSNSSLQQCVEPESEDDDIRFDKSLRELRDLRSQLHYAADYCEKIFLNAKQKKTVLESTKEYTCSAVITVVDHLGSASANLECQIIKNNTISDAELRLNCLKQRLLTCEQYAHKLALSRLRWPENLSRFHPRYLSTPIANIERANGVSRESNNLSSKKILNKNELGKEKDRAPLFLHTYDHKAPLAKNLSTNIDEQKGHTNSLTVLPVRNGLSILSKTPNPTFHFQSTPKLGHSSLFRRSLHTNDILTLLRRTKRSN